MITISAVNQKGGVGKTTTVLNLAYALQKKGVEVLAIDLDPQASLTVALGYDPDTLDQAIDSVMLSETSLSDVLLDTDKGFTLAPSRVLLERLNLRLVNELGREKILEQKLRNLDRFDVVVIDCQTCLSLLTINALSASDYALVPVELAYLSLQGLSLLFDTVTLIKNKVNPRLNILGILPTKYDSRLLSVKSAMDALESLDGKLKVFPPVKKTVAFDRAIEERKPVFLMEGKAAEEAGKVYQIVADAITELIRKEEVVADA